jgi:hypothetical protein
MCGGSCGREVIRKSLLFLKKKKQKDFCSFGPGLGRSANGQKFFGSFFQKRTFFLP